MFPSPRNVSINIKEEEAVAFFVIMAFPTLESLVPTTIEELKKIIEQCKAKSCPLDSIHTSLIKKCFESMLSILVRLDNLSFVSSSFSVDFKIAMVIPLM